MPYQRQTLADLLLTLKASWEGSPFWTDEEARRYINHALRTWNLLTGYWKKKILVSTPSPSSPYIALPGSLTFGMQVVWGATGKPLQLSAIFDLDMAKPRWEEQTTASGSPVPTVPQLWAPNGLTELVIWPADAVGGLPLLVDGVAATPVLVALTDFVDIGDQDVNTIIHYAVQIGAFKRGLATLQATAAYFQDFLQSAYGVNARLGLSTFFRKALGIEQDKNLKPIIGEAAQQQQQSQQPQAPQAQTLSRVERQQQQQQEKQ